MMDEKIESSKAQFHYGKVIKSNNLVKTKSVLQILLSKIILELKLKVKKKLKKKKDMKKVPDGSEMNEE